MPEASLPLSSPPPRPQVVTAKTVSDVATWPPHCLCFRNHGATLTQRLGSPQIARHVFPSPVKSLASEELLPDTLRSALRCLRMYRSFLRPCWTAEKRSTRKKSRHSAAVTASTRRKRLIWGGWPWRESGRRGARHCACTSTCKP